MIQQEITHTFEGLIWKIVVNPERHVLIIEIRKQDQQEVHFYELALQSKQITKIDLPEQNWWYGLQDSRAEWAIFQVFDHQQMPASKEIMAYHLHQKTIKWKYEQVSFHDCNTEIVNVLSMQNESSVLLPLTIETGKISALTTNHTATQKTETYYPVHYKNDNQYFADIAKFIFKIQNHVAVEAIDYLEVGQLILISYYICDADNKLINYFLVLNSEGKPILSETLGYKLNGIGLDTFWIYQNQLVLIKHKTELNIYTIH